MKRILIIEDDGVVAGIYRSRLSMSGYDVSVAVDGAEGLARAKAIKPDLIQLDLSLPKVSGVEIIKAIRADAALKSAAIFVLSNGYLTHLVKQAWEAGADKVLVKAECTPKILVDLIKDHFASSQPAAPAAAPTGATGFFVADQTGFFRRVDAPPGGTGFLYPVPIMHGPVASPAPVPPTARVSAASPGDEEAFEQAARAEFQTTARRETAAMRTLLQGLGRAPEARQSQTALDDLQQKVRHFANNAGIAGARLLGRLASAFEALLKEVHDRPDQLNASILRTFAQATDHLARSVEKLDAADPFAGREPRVLAVDDETLSRKAVHFALQKVGLDALSLDDPQAALNLLRLNRFGLVVLDVDMPGLSGFDLCQQARATPLHGTTPIVFVTGLTDFESRAKSSLSGGSDLIAKPFLFMELGLKALIHLHKLAP